MCSDVDLPSGRVCVALGVLLWAPRNGSATQHAECHQQNDNNKNENNNNDGDTALPISATAVGAQPRAAARHRRAPATTEPWTSSICSRSR